LILDLSSLDQFSVNDGINKNLCSLKYITMGNVAAAISKCGRGALLGKTDIQPAFRIILVHQEDHQLLGMLWKNMVYIKTTFFMIHWRASASELNNFRADHKPKGKEKWGPFGSSLLR